MSTVHVAWNPEVGSTSNDHALDWMFQPTQCATNFQQRSHIRKITCYENIITNKRILNPTPDIKQSENNFQMNQCIGSEVSEWITHISIQRHIRCAHFSWLLTVSNYGHYNRQFMHRPKHTLPPVPCRWTLYCLHREGPSRLVIPGPCWWKKHAPPKLYMFSDRHAFRCRLES